MPLVFPGSNRKKGDEPVDPYELTFRDGIRTVPPYLAELMAAIDTVRYTYDEAVEAVNKSIVRNAINGASDKFIAGHFETRR